METKDNIEWLDMMIQHSGLTDCKTQFVLIRAELELLRGLNKIHEAYDRRTRALLDAIGKEAA